MVNEALRRVQIFSCSFIRGQGSPPKSKNPSTHAVDRKHYTSFESVKFSVFLDNGQPGSFKKFQFIFLFKGCIRKCRPFIRAVSKLKLFNGLIRKSSFLEITKTD